MHFFYVFLILISFCLSCQRKVHQQKQDKIWLNFFAEPTTLEPKRAIYSIYSNIYSMLYDGLTRYGPEGQILLSVADKVEVSEDGKRYTFTLKPTYWSNGDPVTAEHFASAWRWIINPKNSAHTVERMYIIKNGKAVAEGRKGIEEFGVHAKDSETLVVDLEEPFRYFLDLVSLYNFFPSHPNSEVFNGPFLVKEWKQNRVLKLKKNPNYWDKESVKLEKINIQFIQDTHTELKLFEQGELDWAGQPLSLGPPLDAFPSLKKSGILETRPTYSINYYAINTRRAPFSHPKVRLALYLSIPRGEICKHISQAGERPAYDFIPDLIKSDRTPVLASDQEIKQLFEEGLRAQGLNPQHLRSITISLNNSETHSKVAQAIQDRWKSLFGIDVRLKSSDWIAHLSEIEAGNFDIARVQWRGVTPDGLQFIEIFANPHHPMHNTSWKNAKFQNLWKQTHLTKAQDARMKLISEMEEEMRKEVPIIPIYFGAMPHVKSENLTDIVISPNGTIDFKWAQKGRILIQN